MTTTEEGATPAPLPDPNDQCQIEEGSMKRAHSWAWLWEAGTWTDRVRCRLCGAERVNRSEKVS